MHPSSHHPAWLRSPSVPSQALQLFAIPPQAGGTLGLLWLDFGKPLPGSTLALQPCSRPAHALVLQSHHQRQKSLSQAEPKELQQDAQL